MNFSACISSAIDIIAKILKEKRPLILILKEWGQKNRYAGSGDRNLIGNLVHDSLRVKNSAAWRMGWRDGEENPRSIVIGMLKTSRKMDNAEIIACFSGGRFAPSPLTDEEINFLENGNLNEAPHHIIGNYPQWLEPYIMEAFGKNYIEETEALCYRAPLDLRCNSLKTSQENALEEIAHLSPEKSSLSPFGLRILPNEAGRAPYIQGEPVYIKGLVEIQDEGSQIVSLLTGAEPGMQVLDLCAGGGGKTLALAAMMHNKGQIFATDKDIRRLAPIHDRIDRAGVRNVQVRTPRNKKMPLDDLENNMDIVLVDAPCTGTGTWRRHPDMKWHLRPQTLKMRCDEQRKTLDEAVYFVKNGGRLVYVTCSFLAEENGNQVDYFLNKHPNFSIINPERNAIEQGFPILSEQQDQSSSGVLITPSRTNTDGFFICVFQRLY